MKVKQVRLVQKLGKQGYHYDMKEPITKTLTQTSQKLFEEIKSNKKAIENLDESKKYFKTLESMKKNGVIHSSLIRPIAKPLVLKTKSQFRLLDDPDSDKWNNYQMNGEKVTYYDDKLLFRDTGVVFMLRGDILSMITDYVFKEIHSLDAKQTIILLDEMHFDTHGKGKSFRAGNLIKNFYIKRARLASGLRTIFLSENPNELCERLKF